MSSSRPEIPSTEIIRRDVQLESLTVRAADGQSPKIEGYAAVFNRLSEPLNDMGFPFREKVLPGAFTRTLQFADVRALVNHDPNYVLGRSKMGTLTLAEDNHGLAVVITPPDTTWARDLLVSMDRGDINQMSFAFRVIKDKWESEKDESTGKRLDTRILHEVALYDVSVVTYPAYRDTSAQVRTLDLDDVISELIARGLNGRSLASDDQAALNAAIAILQRCTAPTPAEPEPAPIAAHSEPRRSEPGFSSHSPAYYAKWLETVESQQR